MIKNLQKMNYYPHPQPYILNLPSLIFKIIFQPITNQSQIQKDLQRISDTPPPPQRKKK